MVMMSPIKIRSGFEAKLHCQTGKTRCRVHAIVTKLDKQGDLGKPNLEFLKQGDSALVEIVPE